MPPKKAWPDAPRGMAKDAIFLPMCSVCWRRSIIAAFGVMLLCSIASTCPACILVLLDGLVFQG